MLCPAVFKGDSSVEDGVVCSGVVIRSEVTASDKLQVLAGFRVLKTRFKHAFSDYKTFGVKVIKVVACSLAGIFCCKQLIVKADFCLNCVLCTDPVAGALDLAAIGSFAALGLRVVGAVDATHVALSIGFVGNSGYVVGTLKSYFVANVEAVITLGRVNGEVFALNVEFFGERNLSCSGVGIFRVVLHLKVLNLVLGIVVNYKAHRIKNCHDTLGALVQILTDTELHKGVVNNRLNLCNTYAVYKVTH